MKISFPRVPVSIDLGSGPIQTHFRFTTYAVLSIKEQIGDAAYSAFHDPKEWEGLTERERFDVVAAFIWGMLLHAHDDLDIDHVRRNLPAGEEMIAIVESLRVALNRGAAPAQPERPTKGSRKAAPKNRRVNGGIPNASTVQPPVSSSDSPTTNTGA